LVVAGAVAAGELVGSAAGVAVSVDSVVSLVVLAAAGGAASELVLSGFVGIGSWAGEHPAHNAAAARTLRTR
jgi:hypothetical protein